MRIVGNRQRQEFAATPEEALERRARQDAMTRWPSTPFFSRAAFCGTRCVFLSNVLHFGTRENVACPLMNLLDWERI